MAENVLLPPHHHSRSSQPWKWMALKLLTFTLPFGQSWPSRPSRVNEWAGPMDFTSVVVKSIKEKITSQQGFGERKKRVRRVLEKNQRSAGSWILLVVLEVTPYIAYLRIAYW